MEFTSYLQALRQHEINLFGEQRLSNSSVIAIARQAVAKGKVGDIRWLNERIREVVNNEVPPNNRKKAPSDFSV